MNPLENNWDLLWELFEKLTNMPQKAHDDIIASAQLGKETQKQLTKLLDAHYSNSQVLDTPPHWQFDFNQAFQPPSEINGYRIEKKLGSGGMGDVYSASKAEDGFTRKVAIKFATTGRFSQHVLNSFNIELSVLLSLNHANIERLFDGGVTEDNVPFLIVEYIDGLHIDEHCDQYQLNLKQRLQIFQKICGAVAAVHRSLIVHRDIKAGNIMVGKDGEPKLLDFGLAKLNQTDEEKKDQQTTISAQMMTLAYASPEQINAEAITTASDVYSLGVLLYYLITGQLPYKIKANNLSETIKTITEQQSKVASKNTDKESEIFKSEPKLSKKLSGDLEQIVAKAIDKIPDRRYLSVTQFSEDIENYLQNRPVLAKRDSVFYRLAKFTQRHKAGVVLSLVAVASLLFLSLNLFIQSNDLKQSLIEIKQEQKRVLQVTTFLKNIFKTSDPLLTDKKIVNVKDLLDYSSQKLDSQFDDEPKTKASLYITLGQVYLNLSDLTQAEKMFSKAIQLYKNQQDDKGILEVQIAEVRLMQQQGKLNQADTLVSELYQNNRKNLSALKMADIEVLYAQNQSKLGHLKQAEQLLISALNKRLSAHGENNEQVVDIYLLLGNVFWRLGEFDKVKNYYQKAHQSNQKMYGNTNHKTLKSHSSLGVLALAQGDYDLALEHLSFVADERLKKLGKGHILTAEAFNRLGATYYETGEYEWAQEKLTMAKESYEVLGLSNSIKYAKTLNNIGLIERQNKYYKKAQETFQKALKIEKEILGENHDDVAGMHNNLGMVAADMGEIDEAIGLFTKAYQTLEKKYSEDNIKLAFSMTNIGRMYLQKQDPQQAKTWISTALALRQAKLGEDNLYYVETLSASAELDLFNNEYENAIQKLKQVLKVRQQQLPQNDWRIAEAKALYILIIKDKDKDAEKVFNCNLNIVTNKLGASHYRVQMLQKKAQKHNIDLTQIELQKTETCHFSSIK